MATSLQHDIEALGDLPATGLALRVLSRVTGLRVSLVARVTRDSWTACAVHDELGLGLDAGATLELEDTF